MELSGELLMHATKRVVADVEAAEQFYRALGMKVISRNLGGEGDVCQQQSWLSVTGDMSAHILIISRFVELPPPPRVTYPGQGWLCFQVPDVEDAVAAALAAGGALYKAGQDRPEHAVRAAVVSDTEGHYVELVGPIRQR